MLSPGATIDDRYEIIDALGAGGMGAVYRARRIRLGDEVALKVMQVTSDTPPEARDRFLRESRSCAQLHHPNIVNLLDFGFDGARQPYMVMELLSGPSLREEIDLEAPLAPPRVAAILSGVSGALQLAHDRGITHRDLKPANIVAHRYESGERVYKVIDFGLASIKATGDETRLTQPAHFLGTLAYAAPEQLRGETVTPATDIYALGLIAYEMLTGARPFDGANRATVIAKAAAGDVVAPTVKRQGLAAAVDEVVLKALRKSPSERWPSASAFIDALNAAVGESAPPATVTESGVLSRYELGAMLGRGRLGSLVYQGTHRALGVPVAIRVLRRDEQPHWEAVRARFLLEARTLQVAHPSLLQVRDFGEDERSVYLVTDLIDGPSLRQVMAEHGPFSWDRAAAIVHQMLDAASALHARGGYLCGINPDMIRMMRAPDGRTDADRVVLSSAGIRSVQDVLATMREQELRGQQASETELPYLAPEVMMGSAPDARADVFTIAVLAYQLVSGRVPFTAGSLPQLIGHMLQHPPEAPAGLPTAVQAALATALDSTPARRFQTADEFHRALA